MKLHLRLGGESCDVLPFTSFLENEILADGSGPPVWFALDDSRLNSRRSQARSLARG